MSKKIKPMQYSLADVRSGKVEVTSRNGDLFPAIRKEVLAVLPMGKSMLVTDLFPLLASLEGFEGSKRYNYLVNACKSSRSFEFLTVNGRKFIGRTQ